MPQINFTILLPANDTKHAIKMYKALVAQCEEEGIPTSAVSMQVPSAANAGKLSVATPSGSGGNGANVKALCDYLTERKGKEVSQFRVSGQMAQTFGLVGDREQMAGKFLSLLKSGQVQIGQTGSYYKAGSDVSQGSISGEQGGEVDAIDLDEVV